MESEKLDIKPAMVSKKKGVLKKNFNYQKFCGNSKSKLQMFLIVLSQFRLCIGFEINYLMSTSS